MDHSHGDLAGGPVWWAAAAIVFAVLALAAYGAAVLREYRRGRAWPWHRSLLWCVGIATAASGFVGPLAHAAHESFTGHMLAHLLVGMVAPLLLMLSAPVTLTLRVLPVRAARGVSRVLRSVPARMLLHPIVTATLNVGGMWVLYATPLYAVMLQSEVVHVVVMVHFLLAGWLFTLSIVSVDPAPHRATFTLRAMVLVLALAAHGALAKYLYAYPPAGAVTADVQAGAQLMFYGGDAVDLVLMFLLCAEWYRSTARVASRERAAVTRNRVLPERGR